MLCASALVLLPPPLRPVLSYPCPNYVFFHIDTGFKTLYRGHLTILYFVPPVYIMCGGSQLPSPLSSRIRIRCLRRQPRRARQWAEGTARSFRVETVLLGAEDGIPLYDTSLALKVVNSWGQGGRGSLPGDDVVLVTTCTEAVTGSARWSIFLNQVSGSSVCLM